MSVEHAFAVSRGSVTHPDDHGIVAVIDGSKYSFGRMKSI